MWGTVNTDAGESVTSEKSYALPIVYRCISLLSTVIAGCPIDTWRRRDMQKVYHPLLTDNDTMTYTQFELWELVVSHLAAWGNAYVYKKRDPDSGRIIDLKPIAPGRVDCKRDRDGNKIFEVLKLRDDGSPDSANPQIFTSFEIMHIPGLGYDGVKGLSPIGMAAQAIGTAIAADKLAAKFYGKGTQLTGILKVKAPLRSQAQAEGIKARWAAAHGGVGHAGDVAILDAETDWQGITIPPEQLQFLESRRWQTTEIARIFGIPPHLVGDVEKSTSWGTGIEQQNIGFVAYTIAGWTNRIEQRVTREIVDVRGQYCEFNLDRLMRGSTAERYSAYNVALQSGWISAEEVRQRENLMPIEGAQGVDLSKPFPPSWMTQAMGAQVPGAGPDNDEPEGEGA